MTKPQNATIFESGKDFVALKSLIATQQYSQTVVLVNQNTQKFCLPLLPNIFDHIIRIPNGEKHKSIQTIQKIWSQLIDFQCDRKMLLVNLGGGVLTDMGAFAASTYKRGIDCVQIPTSLLAMVDASVGGKTGINFEGIKNVVGTFFEPRMVVINPIFLDTLPKRDFDNGLAEALKHILISDLAHDQMADLSLKSNWDIEFIKKIVAVKINLITQDFYERSVRKQLNYGHTLGHAIEGFSLKNHPKPLLHGEAIAVGMWLENKLANQLGILNYEALIYCNSMIYKYFKAVIDGYHFSLNDLLPYLVQDKKNSHNRLFFSLLRGMGDAIVDVEVPIEAIDTLLVSESNSRP